MFLTSAAAVSWSVVALGFLGLEVRDRQVRPSPLPSGTWPRVAPLVVRGRRLHVTVTRDRTVVAVRDDASAAVTLV